MRESLPPEVKTAVVQFLRDELPSDAKRVYRDMIRNDPLNWSRDPHFAEGVIVRHMLRGNGYDEAALQVADLEPIWPELLRLAVQEEPEP